MADNSGRMADATGLSQQAAEPEVSALRASIPCAESPTKETEMLNIDAANPNAITMFTARPSPTKERSMTDLREEIARIVSEPIDMSESGAHKWVDEQVDRILKHPRIQKALKLLDEYEAMNLSHSTGGGE